MAATNLSNTSGSINDLLYSTDNEMAGSKENEVVNSSIETTAYTLTGWNGEAFTFDPDKIVNPGDGYTLMIGSDQQEAVIKTKMETPLRLEITL